MQTIIEKAISAHENGKLEEAETLYRNILKENPNLDNVHNNLGLILLSFGKYEEAELSLKKAININPNSANTLNNLGVVMKNLNRLNEAEINLKKAIKINPNYADANINLAIILADKDNLNESEFYFKKSLEFKKDLVKVHLGLALTLQKLKKFDEAILNYKKVLKLKPNYIEIFNNLGSILNKIGKVDEAVSVYNEGLNLNPKFEPLLINRGQIFFDKNDFELALKDFDNCNSPVSRSRALPSLYALGRINEIYERIEKNLLLDNLDLNIAAFSSFISVNEGKKTAHNFCNNPMDFIYYSNLQNHSKNSNFFINEIINELDTVETEWEPISKSTYKGFQSKDLFELSLERINNLKLIVLKELDLYYQKFKNETCLYIKKWPSKKKLSSWHVVLKKQGFQSPHIHPSGWLSGVIYLKVVPPLQKNEGAIEFTLNGKYFFNNNSPKITYQPKVGDIVFFPSSLHHKTIPFTTDTDRIIISFDLKPDFDRDDKN